MDASTSKRLLEYSSTSLAEGPVRKTNNTLQKIIRKLRPRARNISRTESDCWDAQIIYRTQVAHSEPPSYDRLLVLDGYKWPLPEPIELLMMRDDVWAGTNFSCERTGADCEATKQDEGDQITLPCGHAFHPRCIHQQLRQYFYARCPTCQHTLHYRLCHHRLHIPYLASGTVMHPDALDGACGTCAPLPFMQEQLARHGPSRRLPKSDKHASGRDFGWHWWILSVFEGGRERYLAERSALWGRLYRACAGGDEREREFALVVFDTLRLLYVHLRSYGGLDWVHALCLVGPIAYAEASLSNGKEPERRGVDIWSCLMDMMVERLHQFHLRGAGLWQPQVSTQNLFLFSSV
ncbi:hypothetical protein TruAng_003904 [Truncatella angustata]|nr:hypothetical protein TruAng_003904 [Truncatella angustata]